MYKKARKCLPVTRTGDRGFRPSLPGRRASGESVPTRTWCGPSAPARQSPACGHAALTRMEQAPSGSARADSDEATLSLVRHHSAVESSRSGQRGSSRGRKLRVPGPVRLGRGLAVASQRRVPTRLGWNRPPRIRRQPYARGLVDPARMEPEASGALTRPVAWGTDANGARLTVCAGRNLGY